MTERERETMSRNEKAYLTPPDLESGDCGVCGVQDDVNEYVEEIDQWVCDCCDPDELEQ